MPPHGALRGGGGEAQGRGGEAAVVASAAVPLARAVAAESGRGAGSSQIRQGGMSTWTGGAAKVRCRARRGGTGGRARRRRHLHGARVARRRRGGETRLYGGRERRRRRPRAPAAGRRDPAAGMRAAEAGRRETAAGMLAPAGCSAAGSTSREECRLFSFFLCEGVWEKCVTSGMVGNFNQLHQLQEWVEHLLRSSKKKVEWS